jgi:hypothetical protein
MARFSVSLMRACFDAGSRCGPACPVSHRCSKSDPAREGRGAHAWFCPAPPGAATVGALPFALGRAMGRLVAAVPRPRSARWAFALFSARCAVRCAGCSNVACPRAVRRIAPGLAMLPGRPSPFLSVSSCGANVVAANVFLPLCRFLRALRAGRAAAALRARVLARSGSYSGGA